MTWLRWLWGWRPGRRQRVLANETATLLAMEQDPQQYSVGLDWLRGARAAIPWAAGEPGALRPSELMRRSRLAAISGGVVGSQPGNGGAGG